MSYGRKLRKSYQYPASAMVVKLHVHHDTTDPKTTSTKVLKLIFRQQYQVQDKTHPTQCSKGVGGRQIMVTFAHIKRMLFQPWVISCDFGLINQSIQTPRASRITPYNMGQSLFRGQVAEENLSPKI